MGLEQTEGLPKGVATQHKIENGITHFLSEASRYAIVADLDPLQIDEDLVGLPELNAQKDAQGLLLLLRKMYRPDSFIEKLTQEEALAVLRDIGMVASSLRRLNLEPFAELPQVEGMCVLLSKKTGAVPRDTVYTYAAWNPQGEKRRTFTNTSEEHLFINSVTNWLENIDACLVLLSNLNVAQWPNGAVKDITRAREHFEAMVASMVSIRKLLPTAVFYDVLQPYFYPFHVDGVEYEAPSGAHMNLLLMDQMLWGAGKGDEVYQKYLTRNSMYIPPHHAVLLQQIQQREPLVAQVKKLSQQNPEQFANQESAAALELLLEMLNKVVSFRRIHFTVAKEQEAIRLENGKEAKLTGNDILSYLLRESAVARDTIKEVYEASKQKISNQFGFPERAQQEKVRPLTTLSTFVCEGLPLELEKISTGENSVNWLEKHAEELIITVQPHLESLLESRSPELALARLDVLFLEMAIVHSGGQSGPLLSNTVERLSTVLELPACFTYEDLIFVNPSSDIRTFTRNAVGDSEKAFYEGHKYIEDKLLSTIAALQQAISLLLLPSPDKVELETLLRPIPSELHQAREHMQQFHHHLPKEHFFAFAKFHDKNLTRPESKSAGGQFSASIPTIDLLLAGEEVPEQVLLHWSNHYRYFPVRHRDMMNRALEQSIKGLSLKSLIENKLPELKHILNEIDSRVRSFRSAHYGAVHDKLSEEMVDSGTNQSKLARFLRERIAINHRSDIPLDSD